MNRKKYRFVLFLLYGIGLTIFQAFAQRGSNPPVPDFSFELPSGEKQWLYDLPSAYTLIFLHNPECDICYAVSDSLAASRPLSALVESGALTVLGISAEENREAWQQQPSHWRPEWVNAFDPEANIIINDVYDVQRIPSLYLLNKKKELILKNVSTGELEKALGDLQKR